MTITMLRQSHLDYLIRGGVPPLAIVSPSMLMLTEFESLSWICIPEDRGWVYWQPRTGEIRTDDSCTFAIGEDWITNPASTAFDQWLTIFPDPLHWLRASREGIVVLKWQWAFDRLRHVERVAVFEQLLDRYKKYMRPPKLPKLGIVLQSEAAA